MRKLTYYLLWVFVFSLAWERVPLPGIGRVTNLIGMTLIAVGMLTAVMYGRFRKPGVILWLNAAFVLSASFSSLWSTSTQATLERAQTYAQLATVAWIVWEFARTQEEQRALLVAFCLGMYVPVVGVLQNFARGIRIYSSEPRFTGGNLNADELGLICALIIPMSWYLVLNSKGLVRLMVAVGFVLAPVGLLLTATRGAFLASLVGVSIVPLTLMRLSLRSVAFLALVLVVAVGATATIVPATSWTRIFTIGREFDGGTNLGGRTGIWAAGWGVFQHSPVLGVGAGGFEDAVYRLSGVGEPAHNTLLAVLVEQGLVGFSIFVALHVVAAHIIWRLAPNERKFWGVLMLSWFVGVMSVHWQYHKLTWLLFGLLAAQGALRPERWRRPEPLSELEAPTFNQAHPRERWTAIRLQP